MMVGKLHPFVTKGNAMPGTIENPWAKHFEFAQFMATVAEEMCKDAQKQGFEKRQKTDNTWVTAADLAIENRLRDMIEISFPNIPVLGEEEGGEELQNDGQLRWVLDPIDGTFSFVHGLPFYSSLIALCEGLTPVVGIASLPGMNIRMSALQGGGVFLNGASLEPSPLLGASQIELFSTADHHRFRMAGKGAVLQKLLCENLKSRVYCDALGYYLLLQGNIRAFVDPKVEVWDVAPFHCILKEAGFAIHGWNDQNSGLCKGTSVAYPVKNSKPMNCEDVLSCLVD
jgi:fructose-1,6-bisphosphatase/inositol monophosphatase family enzyme